MLADVITTGVISRGDLILRLIPVKTLWRTYTAFMHCQIQGDGRSAKATYPSCKSSTSSTCSTTLRASGDIHIAIDLAVLDKEGESSSSSLGLPDDVGDVVTPLHGVTRSWWGDVGTTVTVEEVTRRFGGTSPGEVSGYLTAAVLWFTKATRAAPEDHMSEGEVERVASAAHWCGYHNSAAGQWCGD
jgi:hypothetical protein